MANDIQVFRAGDGGTVNIAATSSSANVRLFRDGLFIRGNGIDVRVANTGSGVIFIKFATTSTLAVATSTADIPILPNTVENFRISMDQAFVAAITSTNGTIYFTPGFGA